ncbi:MULTISPECIES: LysR family transcriptional regulator [unclassified Caulobacter]|uniref:LysR family transcriptional regulator n=1 Tax=unclassified Caulobacter TaxID=2648921 RepID=UPI000D465292|nr:MULTISPECIES: LysR family transcriptional regulator [unclassified Caulobacter]PTS90312.1 hypothetical protein DBR21_04300 [Caulobacter sp. HMWF009]PTT11477.1 hypothetical protein DBR10_03380 [Caulobacter sp. HMWF025]
MAFDILSAVQFVTVAEELSFTRAAARLGIAQPWLSRRIQLLEAQLGFRLFVRSTRRIELTEKGEAFLAAARPLAYAAAAAAQTARMLGRAEQRRLRIGVPPYGGRIPLRSQLTRRYSAENPEVALELEIGWTPRLLERVVAGDLDGAFGMGWLDLPLRRLTLCHLGLKLRVAPQDTLANQDEIGTDALAGRRVAVFARGLYPELFDALFTPLAERGVKLIQTPEFHERLIEDDGGSPPLIVAEFRIPGQDGGSGPWLVDVAPVPFSLFVPAGPLGADVERFWATAGDLIRP